jgi:uracil-DNA glycosylase
MGFCYPGKGTSGDLPPRPECAPLWHTRVLAALPQDRLTLLVGSFAQKYYLGAARGQSMTEIVRDHLVHAPAFFPLPHPSWRSRIWMGRNPWFETAILPELKNKVKLALL